MSTHARREPSFEEMTFTEPRTVLFAVGDKDSVETKLSWRWCRDNMLLPSDNLWLVHARRKDSGWVPLDSVKTLSDVSLAKDWLPSEIAHSIHGMQHKLIVIDTTHDTGEALLKFISLETPRDAILVMGSRGRQGWRKFLLGSVSSYVVQYAPIPLLVVRSRKYRDIPDLTSDTVGAAYLGMTQPGKSRTVAVAVDGTAASLALVKWACLNALKTNDQVHVLHSAVSETPIQTADAAEQVKKCMDALNEFQKDDEVGNATSVLLDIKGACKTYPGAAVSALSEVDLSLRQGGTLGIVGGSGCGKTTLARVILGLHRLDRGAITLDGRPVQDLEADQVRHIRSNVGLVFQDPRSALNPRRRIGDAIEEVLIRWGHGKAEANREARKLITAVGLEEDALNRKPDAFSGGQRQRIVIARALAADPKLLICDEAVAALDVSVQAQVLNLLVELRRERGLALLFISHDLGVVRYLCDHTVVMDAGRVVESGSSDAIWASPAHEVTRRLQSAGGGAIA